MAHPLRGLHPDAAHVRTVLATIPGPSVVVGDSYGGAVITEAASSPSVFAADGPAAKAALMVSPPDAVTALIVTSAR